MPKVVVIGEILVEVMADRVGQSFLEAGMFSGPFASGAPAIFIDQVAKAGVSAGIIGAVGCDDFGRVNIRRLQRDGVDVSRIREIEDNATGVAFVTYAPDGSRQFIFHNAHAACGQISPEDVDHSWLEGMDCLHVMGCSLSSSDSMREAILTAVREAKRLGKRVSFDPNIRMELIRNERIKDIFAEILAATDVLLTGREELQLITGKADFASALKAAREKDIDIVVVKSASRGASVFWGGEETIAAPFSVKEVDPTGAGDCFDGAFIASLLLGKTIEEAARIANAAGAMSVTKRGPMEGTVTMAEIQSFMQGRRR